jgi:hypothetical protein
MVGPATAMPTLPAGKGVSSVTDGTSVPFTESERVAGPLAEPVQVTSIRFTSWIGMGCRPWRPSRTIGVGPAGLELLDRPATGGAHDE